MSGSNTFALLAAMCGIAAIAVLIERSDWGKRLSAPAIIVILAIVASELRIIPSKAPLYDAIWRYGVPLAIALFLIKADVVKVFREGGRVLLAFMIGLLGAVAGALLGVALLDLGADEAKLAAVFSATYTGGSLNFAAVAQAVEFTDATRLSAALAIDNVLGTAYIVALNLLAGYAPLREKFAWRIDTLSNAENHVMSQKKGLELHDALITLTIAACACAIGNFLAGLLGIENYALLVITVCVVLVATIIPGSMSRLKGEDILAMLIMYLFFAMIGAGADITAMVNTAPALSLFVLCIFVMHLIFLFIGARLFRLNYAEITVGSLACITGPPVAAAIAVLFNWRSLVLPGILTGVFGYVVGNFVGIGMHELFIQ